MMFSFLSDELLDKMAAADNSMQTDHFTSQNTIISKSLQTEEDRAALRQHVYEIAEGRAFRGSERSIRFLEFIVEKAIEGDLESLKERMIGIELFGRSPSYSTSKDAIVRVTASDVRKRLLQHYGWYGRASKFQISLPRRTYIPEIEFVRPDRIRLKERDVPIPAISTCEAETTGEDLTGRQNEIRGIASMNPRDPRLPALNAGRFVFYGTLTAVLVASFWLLGAHYLQSKIATTHAMTHLALPWPMLTGSTRPLQVVTSDRGLVDVETLVHKPIAVSQYANHIYLPDAGHMEAEVVHLCNEILASNRAAAVDIPIVVGITELAERNLQKVSVHMARDLGIQDLNTDGNFVFLGSPRSNPWVSLYEDQMDFRFGYDQNGREFIEDVHPRPSEGDLPRRLIAAGGRTYSIIAFLPNPNAHGSVLILSGLDIEGTQAAGRLITDLPRMSEILHDCGVGENGTSPYFELLLHPQIIAGASTNTGLAACHTIQARTH